jgi:hypothetical protein
MFDWRGGENCQNFGISRALFTEFSAVRNKESDAVREVERQAQAARTYSQMPDPERVITDLKARLKAQDAQIFPFS